MSDQPISVRIPADLLRRLRIAAALGGESRSDLIIRILDREVPSTETLSKLVAGS